MAINFDAYLTCPACEALKKDGYEQVIQNILMDDELYVTDEMKKEFFEYIYNYDGKSNLKDYCDDFFYKSPHQLKGKSVPSTIYKIQLGRVCSKNGFRRGLNTTIFKSMALSGLSPISDISDEALLESLLIDSSKINSPSSSKFYNFIIDTGIADEKIQEYPMWTFEGFYDQAVFEGYNIKDLPCILGLPGPTGTSDRYWEIERISFSLRIPTKVIVRKPTSFDAGIMAVWTLGGKTKIHKDCEPTYGSTGFEEYIHEPIDFKDITSELYYL